MTFAEKLDRAKSGSRAAYESLCLTSVDGLYTAALIALKNGLAAEEAVRSAVKDGYAGIARIKDERHLRSWLVHELTKHIVDKLKEFRTNGVTYSASGKFAETERLPDVERLVFAVSACFGYGTKELSVLTGMSESAVSEKLSSARNRFGAGLDAIEASARENSAPVMLKEKYRAFDESLERLEHEETPAPEETAPDPSEAEETPFLREIAIEPAAYPEEDTEDDHEVYTSGQPEKNAPDGQAERYENKQYETDGNESVFAEESADLAAIPAGQSAAERFGEDNGRNGKRPVLNAETFIGVVSAEQIKGSEFLRLIGNTRISNNVYREIEQNPRLTKQRLISLLEQSPLNETDYYKLLTAIKHRREVINAKEESRLIHARAGLFDGSQITHSKRRHAREAPKTDLQLAIEAEAPKKDIPLMIDEKHILEDDNDYVIKNGYSDRMVFGHEDGIRDQRIPIITNNQKSLGAIINEVSKEKESDGKRQAFHPADMDEIFNNNTDNEAVDPIAAIYAHETGEQAKPKRIEELHNEWNLAAEKQAEERADNVDNSSGTQEFNITAPEPEKTYDTREFKVTEEEKPTTDLVFGSSDEDTAGKQKEKDDLYIIDTASMMLDQEDDSYDPSETPESIWGRMSYIEEKHDEPEIETIPVSNGGEMSVTRIISDYSGKSPDGAEHVVLPGASDVTAILDVIPKQTEKAPAAEDVHKTHDTSVSDSGAYSPGIIPEDTDEPEKPQPAKEKPVTAVKKSASSDSEGGYVPIVPDEMLGTQEIDIDAAASGDRFIPPEPDSDDADGSDDDDFTSKKRRTLKEKNRPDRDGGSEKDDIIPDEPDKRDTDDTAGGRERYKGNEYFPDDDEFYEGVNRGKIIFCIICAVLLVGGALAMKFLTDKDKPDVQPDDKSGNTSVSETAEPTVTEIPGTEPVDDSDILTRLTEFEDRVPYEVSQLTSSYLRASAEPYEPFLSKTVIRTDDILYIYNDGKIKAVSLDPEQPEVIAETTTDKNSRAAELYAHRGGNYVSEFIGYTFYNEKLYVVSQVTDKSSDTTGKPRTEVGVYVEIFSPDLTADSDYYIDGKLCGMGISGGKLVAVTYMVNGGLHFETGKPVLLPTATGNEVKEPSDIIKLNSAESNGFAVIGEVGGSGFTVISGCMMCYPKFDGGDGFTLLCADCAQTFAVEISSALETASAKRYAGRAFSEDCLNGDRFIGADMTGGKASGTVASVGKNALTTGVAGETPFAVAWTDDKKTACVLSSQENGGVMLYGFDMSGETPASSSDVTVDSVYSDKLIAANGKLMGLKLEGSEESARAGFRLSEYYYDGKRTESAYTVITADDKSADKYIRSPAESDTAAIAVSGAGLVAFPMIYFDGFSEVERVTVFSSTLEQIGEVLLYDEKSSVLCAAFSGNNLFVVTDRHIIVADVSDLENQKTFILE